MRTYNAWPRRSCSQVTARAAFDKAVITARAAALALVIARFALAKISVAHAAYNDTFTTVARSATALVQLK